MTLAFDPKMTGKGTDLSLYRFSFGQFEEQPSRVKDL
jgi:hypothetical protein